jgi:hypothetical protein
MKITELPNTPNSHYFAAIRPHQYNSLDRGAPNLTLGDEKLKRSQKKNLILLLKIAF